MTAEPSRPVSSAGSVPAQPAPPEIAPEVVPETSPTPETSPPEVPATPGAPDAPATAEAPTPHPATPAPAAPEPASAPTDEGASRSSGEGSASPTKVRIDTPGATIEIEANESLAEVVATALRLFHEAGGWPQVNSRSAGFAQAERRETYPVQPSSMPYGPGSYPVQMP
ncbi:hypothetical protein [Plantactinospora sp. KLBMP9567]|uniref:hypothetical protein n=1 Tax=Plantactinospora sp. KLBMP9567 TaxID=3085900 RepID=UPI002981E330|nr:hypothetical protein [Plantactinospora sp. KLBMP9567]MDW5327910.1 hypothetical protein [Plantactinospora sp. KLBMP9567]